MGSIRAVFKFFLFFLLCLIVVPIQGLILFLTKGRISYVIPYIFHTSTRAIFGVKYKITGKPITNAQVIFMSNHVSYLDIPLIGSVIKASFVAKKDVASWPVFGFLSKLQQTYFIERKRSVMGKESKALEERMNTGHSLIIFPEGTSTDGRGVEPFKSSLFKLALGSQNPDILVQPMTLKLTQVDGKVPETQEIRDLYSWHRDMDTPLGPHLWAFAQTKGATLEIIFHDPLVPVEFEDRKTLAKTCHERVSNGLEILQAA